MKLFLPKQHGAWAMLTIPFWLGVIEGGYLWKHIPFFVGWLLLYLATYPILLLFKRKKIPFYTKWTLIYMIPALLLLLVPLLERLTIFYFGLMNDISAIFAFSIAGLASSYLAHGVINIETIIFTFLTSVLFFIGCTFYVKTMIREKKNNQFKWISWIYHILLVAAWFGFGFWIVAIAYIPSFLRAIILYGKPLSTIQIGIYEIINSAIFFTIIAIQIVLLK